MLTASIIAVMRNFRHRHFLAPVACSVYRVGSVSERSSFRSCSSGLTSDNAATKSSPTQRDEPFDIFYRFSYIRTARLLCRMKIYQTGLTVLFVPPSIYCYASGLISLESCSASVGLCTAAMALLYVVGHFFRRVVGLIALNPDESVLRISRLTFWGNRRDIYLSPEDVVPLSDVSERKADAYVKLCRYSTTDVLYLFLRYGEIENYEKFYKVFGKMH